MDISQQQAKTVAVKACFACASGILESDKFCRWCGAQQIPFAHSDFTSLISTAAAFEASTYRTSVLASGAREDVYRKVSAPLVNAVVSGALAGPAIEKRSPALTRVILGLISVPVWLIIVLLSPIDAYAAVRNLARQA
jgi:RNA polymerase subunit RPABC4/transcription elongation factor Spt4